MRPGQRAEAKKPQGGSAKKVKPGCFAANNPTSSDSAMPIGIMQEL